MRAAMKKSQVDLANYFNTGRASGDESNDTDSDDEL